jgi:hypothetical protein
MWNYRKSMRKGDFMRRQLKALMIVAAGAMSAAGCASDRPHDYGRERPSITDLDSRDRGLQSRDVVFASDRLAADLLADPGLNRSDAQWTLVVDRVEDNTIDHRFRQNYDIFIERLRTNIARQGRGRVQLIENKSRFYNLRNKELEGEREDVGQSSGGGQPRAQEATQPDYALYGKAMDMPNRGTNYYLLQFDVVNLRNRQQVWNGEYEVRVAR